MMKRAKSFSFYTVLLILHSTITYLCYAGFATSGLNILVPAFASKNGLDQAMVLSANTTGALCGVVGIVVFAHLVTKVGERLVTICSFALAGILGMAALGFVDSYAGYLFCSICTQFFAVGYSQGTTNSIIARWFPERRGSILGITTLGLPLASIVITPLLNMSIESRGLNFTVFVMGGFLVLMGVLSRFMIYNTPEEVGCCPENDPARKSVEAKQYVSKWTISKLVRTKETWLLAIGFGVTFLITVAYSSQMIPYLTEQGFTQSNALVVLSLFAVVGSIFSVLTGLLDTKIGTKKASMVFMIWNIVAILIGIIGRSNHTLILISILMLSNISGGAANLLPSFIVNVFGAQDYTAANRVIFTTACILRAFAFTLIAIGIKMLGSYYAAFGATIFFAIIGFICVVLIPDRRLDPNEA